MIVGIGIDMCSVERIHALIERHGERFLNRVFCHEERERCGNNATAAEKFAARFAAKEATMKALGTGWTAGVRFADIHVFTEPVGRPYIHLTGIAAQRAVELGVDKIHLSLSHEQKLAIAFVIFECDAEKSDNSTSL